MNKKLTEQEMADLIAAEQEYFKNQAPRKRGVLEMNMTQEEYDEYKKKYPDGQPNVEINIVKKKAKGGMVKKYAKGGMANKKSTKKKSKKAGRLAMRGYGIARK